MKPLPNRIIIRPDKPEEKKGNIYLAPSKQKPREGEVIQAGENDYGIEQGQRVIFNWWKADIMDEDTVVINLNKAMDIVAIIG